MLAVREDKSYNPTFLKDPWVGNYLLESAEFHLGLTQVEDSRTRLYSQLSKDFILVQS